MRRFIFGLLLTLSSAPVLAQSLNDQTILAGDNLFIQRVKQSMIAAAVAISSDGLTTGINVKRHAQVQSIMNSPDSWKSNFASAIATQSAFNSPATSNGSVVLKPMVCSGQANCTETGNVDTQQVLVSDSVINTAVASVFNSFFGGQ